MTEITREQVIEAMAKAIETEGSEVCPTPKGYAVAALMAIEELGLKIVPYKPTEGMLDEAFQLEAPSTYEVYQKMLSSSPLYREEDDASS